MSSYYRRTRQRDAVQAYIFVAPVLILLTVFAIVPIIYAVAISFRSWSYYYESAYVRFDNYLVVLKDPIFRQTILNAFRYLIYVIPAQFVICFFLANLIYRLPARGAALAKTTIYVPTIVSGVIASLVFTLIYHYTGGLANYLMKLLGVGRIAWTNDPGFSMLTVAIPSIWLGIGVVTLIMLAGLNDIPSTYFEAASLDGATALQQFRHITVPMISPALFFVLIMRTMNAVRQFDLSFMIANDRQPGFRNVQTLLYQFYRETFIKLNANYGASIVLWTVMIILFITAFQFFMEKRWVNYDA